MPSRSVLSLTHLQQHNNHKKSLGPVGNAICSSLPSVFLACHFSRRGEKLLHTWQRLVQMLQGYTTVGGLQPMPEAIFVSDRGYNIKETLLFLSDTLGATILGTHKRDLWYPFVYRAGAISNRSKGVRVSETGCRAAYSAKLLHQGFWHVRRIEACVYRESCSGRVAALVHNNGRLFPSSSFTVVLKEVFRAQAYEAEEFPILYRTKDRRYSSEDCRLGQILSTVRPMACLEFEDHVWFLLRAFRFTSRTSHGLFVTSARDYDHRMKGLSHLLRGKTLRRGADPLPQELNDVLDILDTNWTSILDILGMQPQDQHVG